MSLQTQKYTRKPFPIEAVQVTTENMRDVAEWCKGEVITTDSKIAEALQKTPETYIKVKASNPMNDRQTQAFPGDWVLYANKGYKVYTDKSFKRSFDEIVKAETPSKPSPPQVPTPAVMHTTPTPVKTSV